MSGGVIALAVLFGLPVAFVLVALLVQRRDGLRKRPGAIAAAALAAMGGSLILSFSSAPAADSFRLLLFALGLVGLVASVMARRGFGVPREGS